MTSFLTSHHSSIRINSTTWGGHSARSVASANRFYAWRDAPSDSAVVLDKAAFEILLYGGHRLQALHVLLKAGDVAWLAAFQWMQSVLRQMSPSIGNTKLFKLDALVYNVTSIVRHKFLFVATL